jgi:hypothetical protein
MLLSIERGGYRSVFHNAVSYVVCGSSAVLARTLDARRLNYSLSLRKSLQLPIPTRFIYSFRSSSAFYLGGSYISGSAEYCVGMVGPKHTWLLAAPR